MEGHAHISVMTFLDVLSYVAIGFFLIRVWAGLRPDNPALKGAAFVF